ncbi:hypothetical protein FACS1894105_14520 [Clostridia bacterium]|nr:hypothetical protein FACS1894105_14520 [Clostridia bacterium]
MKIDNISVNTLLKSSDSEHVYKILWLSDDRLYAYLFDITAMVMPELGDLSDIAHKIQDGSLAAQDNDPYVKAVAEDRLNDHGF